MDIVIKPAIKNLYMVVDTILQSIQKRISDIITNTEYMLMKARKIIEFKSIVILDFVAHKHTIQYKSLIM